MALNPDFHRVLVSRVASSIGDGSVRANDTLTLSGKLADGTACSLHIVIGHKSLRARCLVKDCGLDCGAEFLQASDLNRFLRQVADAHKDNETATTETVQGLFLWYVRRTDDRHKAITLSTPAGGAELNVTTWQAYYFETALVAVLRTRTKQWF